MKNITIRSTAGDGAWLDGLGGLARGVAMGSNSGTHGEPLRPDGVFLDVALRLPPGSDGVWLAWGLICPLAGGSLKRTGRRRKVRGVSARCGAPEHFNCRCAVERKEKTDHEDV